jgi:hypothetical protein
MTELQIRRTPELYIVRFKSPQEGILKICNRPMSSIIVPDGATRDGFNTVPCG